MLQTCFVNVQHLHFYPVTEDIVSKFVIHSAHIQLSLSCSYTQVCFSATSNLRVSERKQKVGDQKHKTDHSKFFGVTYLIYDAVVIRKPLVFQGTGALSADTQSHPVVHRNTHGDRMPHNHNL